MLNSIKPKARTVFLYLIVPVVFFVFTVFVPLVTAFVYSFFEWKGGPKKTFIGIDNYVQLFHDATFWQSFGHNIYLVIACIIGQIGIAFIMVMIVNSKVVKLKGIHRTFGFFPSMLYFLHMFQNCSMSGLDLEYDLSQPVWYHQLVFKTYRP